MVNLTENTEKLFKQLLDDAGDWDGSPMLNISKEERGNLSDLKKKGLIKTSKDDENKSVVWVIFTELGLDEAFERFGFDKEDFLNLL